MAVLFGRAPWGEGATREQLGTRSWARRWLYQIAFQFRFNLNSGSRSVGQFGDSFELAQKGKKNLMWLEVQSRP